MTARRGRWVLLGAGVIIAAGVLAYSNSFSGPFIFDGIESIERNQHIRKLWPITEAIKAPKEATVSGRPVVSLSLAINYAISGLDVWSYHAFNLIVHLIAALLLFGIIRRTLLSERLRDRFARDATLLGGICAVLWVVHPLNTQAVTYVVQRAESMMGMFYLLTLYCAARGFAARRPVLWYSAAVLACTVGMGTKEVMVTAPLVVLLYDRIFVSRSMGRLLEKRWGFYLFLSASWVVLLRIILMGPRSASAGFELEDLTPPEYARTQCKVIVHYIRLAFYPSPLILDYPRKTVEALAEYAPQAGILLVLLLGTLVALKYKPVLGFVGAWFFVILAPTSSFVPVADPIFEHRMYLPLAAVLAGVVLGVYLLASVIFKGRPAGRELVLVLAAVGGITLGLMTYLRNRDYRSRLDIWADTVEKVPDSSFAWYNLAVALSQSEQRRNREAIAKCDEAIRLKEDYAEAYCHRGGCYLSLGQLDRALDDLNKAIELKPGYAPGFVNRGSVYTRKREYDRAISDFSKAIELNPDDPRSYFNRGSAYRQQGQLDRAIADYDTVIERRSDYFKAYAHRGLAYALKEDYERAIRDLDKAIELNPTYADARTNKAIILRRLELRRSTRPYRQRKAEQREGGETKED